jgi:hypothetical protein
MNSHIKKWAALAVIVIAACVSDVHAYSSTGTIEIHVSITSNKSLHVGTTFYDYGQLGVDVSSVSSGIVITNDSSALVETYRIQGSSAVSNTGGTDWALASSTSTDQYALAAIFQTAQPSDSDSAFTSDDTTYNAVTCTDSVFGNGTHAQAGDGVPPTGATTRNLWFRIRTPDVVTDPGAHTATVTLSVL